MLKINLIEQVAKQQEVLNTKNKISSAFFQKTLYYSEEEPVTKAVATNTGNINASDMMGTQTVFPSDKAGADGEYLIYLMPRFVRGRNVYRLFNTESSKQINNTVKVSNSSLGNYVYQVDQTSTPEQAKEEGETVEVENTERSVERNRANRIKPIQTEETPEQYQERFMKEYQDLVRDINGALSDIDPEQVLKQWQQKQKELEEKQIEQQELETFKFFQGQLSSAADVVDGYIADSCAKKPSTNKSIFFNNIILKAKSTFVNLTCEERRDFLVKFFLEMHGHFVSQGIKLPKSPFVEGTYAQQTPEVKAFIDIFCGDAEGLQQIRHALNVLYNNPTIKSGHKTMLMYLMLSDAYTKSLTTTSENTKEPELVAWIDSFRNSASEFSMRALVNAYNYDRSDNMPYTETVKYAEHIDQLAKAMIIARNKPIDPLRPVESFFGTLSIAMLNFELAKHLKKEEIPTIELKVGLGISSPLSKSMASEIQSALDSKDDIDSKKLKEYADLISKATILRLQLNVPITKEQLKQLYAHYTAEQQLIKTGFIEANDKQLAAYAAILQEQIPTWLYAAKKPPTAEDVAQMYKLNQETQTSEEFALIQDNPAVADLPAFSIGEFTVQFDTPEILNSHGVINSYSDDEFQAFVETYVSNIAKKYFGIKDGCSKNRKITDSTSAKEREDIDVCDRLSAHVHFIIGRDKASAKGGHSDKGETFENVLMLDQLTRMLDALPGGMEEDDHRVRFNGKTGRAALEEYLRCKSTNTRHNLKQSDPSTTTKDEKITRRKDIEGEESEQPDVSEITLGEFAEGIMLRPVNKQDLIKRAQEIKLDADKFYDGKSSFEASPVYRDRTTGEIVEATTKVTINVKQEEYSTAFFDEVEATLAELEAAKTEEEKAEILKRLDSSVFKFLAVSLVGQKNVEERSKTVISAVTHMLEGHARFSKLNPEQQTRLKKLFAGKMNHVSRYIQKYGTTIKIGKTFEVDEIQQLIAADSINIDLLAQAVASKEKFEEMLKLPLGNSGISLNEWLDNVGSHFARKLTINGLAIERYVEHFRDKFLILLEKEVLSGTTLDEELIISLIHKAKLEGIRVAFDLMDPQTPIDAVYTQEDQETFLKQLRASRLSAPSTRPLPVYIRAKSASRQTQLTIPEKAKDEARDARQAIASAIDEATAAAGATFDEQTPIVQTEKTAQGFLDRLKEFFPESEAIKGSVNVQPAIRIVRLLNEYRGNVRVLNENGTSSEKLTEDEINALQNALSAQRSNYPLKDNPIEFSIEKGTRKAKKGAETKELHVLKIKFKAKDSKGNPITYVIEIPQAPPTGYKLVGASKSFLDFKTNKIITKGVFFFAQASKPESFEVAGKPCPQTNLDGKINLDAVLTIQDDDGITFFNISKLDGIPGASSGFADLAHLRVKGLTRDKKTGEFIGDKDLDLEMSVVEGKIGEDPASLKSFSRIEAIQNGIIGAALKPQQMARLKTARYNVFLGRAHNGRIAYGRAKGSEVAFQLGRIHIDVPAKTSSINSNNLQKILKSIWT